MFPLAVIAGAALAGTAASAYGSKRAADAQKDASQASIAEQQRQYNNSMLMYEPSRQLGYGAMNDIASLYGYPLPAYQSAQQLLGTNQSGPATGWGSLLNRFRNPSTPSAAPAMQSPMLGGRSEGAPGDMSRFFASPDYNFRRTEGQRGLEQSAAARGGAFSGDALKDLTSFNSGLASGEFGNYMNRLFNVAGMGQTATNASANAGQNYANQYSNAQQNIGDARASGIMGTANSITNSLNSGLNNWLLYQGGWFNRPTGA